MRTRARSVYSNHIRYIRYFFEHEYDDMLDAIFQNEHDSLLGLEILGSGLNLDATRYSLIDFLIKCDSI